MGKDNKGAVRLHIQEREWLLSLGNGDLVEGVDSLIQETKRKQPGEDNYSRFRRRNQKR